MVESRYLSTLLACADCDALYTRPVLPVGATARCERCGTVLLRRVDDSIGTALALAVAALILFVPANTFTFFSFGLAGRVQESTITGGAQALYEAGYGPLGALIYFASVLAPLVNLLAILYICLPLRLGRVWPGTRRVFVLYDHIRPWGMLNVYLLGALVAIVKMGDYGDMVLGVGFYAFLALLLVATKAQTSLEADDVWRRVEAAR